MPEMAVTHFGRRNGHKPFETISVSNNYSNCYEWISAKMLEQILPLHKNIANIYLPVVCANQVRQPWAWADCVTSTDEGLTLKHRPSNSNRTNKYVTKCSHNTETGARFTNIVIRFILWYVL